MPWLAKFAVAAAFVVLLLAFAALWFDRRTHRQPKEDE